MSFERATEGVGAPAFLQVEERPSPVKIVQKRRSSLLPPLRHKSQQFENTFSPLSRKCSVPHGQPSSPAPALMRNASDLGGGQFSPLKRGNPMLKSFSSFHQPQSKDWGRSLPTGGPGRLTSTLRFGSGSFVLGGGGGGGDQEQAQAQAQAQMSGNPSIQSPSYCQIREQFSLAADLSLRREQHSYIRSDENMKVGTKLFEKTRNPIEVARELNKMIWRDASYSTIKADLRKIEQDRQKMRNQSSDLLLLQQTRKKLHSKKTPHPRDSDSEFRARPQQQQEEAPAASSNCNFSNTLHRDVTFRLKFQNFKNKKAQRSKEKQKDFAQVSLVEQIKLEGEQPHNGELRDFIRELEKGETKKVHKSRKSSPEVGVQGGAGAGQSPEQLK